MALAYAGKICVLLDGKPPRGRTKVARACKTRRSEATPETHKAASLRENRITRPPPHVHGKEGVDGPSPSEGFEKLPANTHFLSLGRRRRSHVSAVSANCGPRQARNSLQMQQLHHALHSDPVASQEGSRVAERLQPNTCTRSTTGPATAERSNWGTVLGTAAVPTRPGGAPISKETPFPTQLVSSLRA
jgi:hypothetical protein